MEVIITGLVLGGTYALVALGLNIQYGISRIMNLANGELLVAGGLAAFWFWTAGQISPMLTLIIVAPSAFILNYLIYVIMLRPLVRRAKSQGELEVGSILATFGLAFVELVSCWPSWAGSISATLPLPPDRNSWLKLRPEPHHCVPRSGGDVRAGVPLAP